MNQPKQTKNTAIAQNWDELEKGWGARPDGFTLHLNSKDQRSFNKAYWKAELQRTGGIAPAEYTRESGKPFPVIVDTLTYEILENFSVQQAKPGLWGNGKFLDQRSTQVVTGVLALNQVFEHTLIRSALQSVDQDFIGKTRKVPQSAKVKPDPFSVHPKAVATLLTQHSFPVRVICAGLLHDHLEDLPKLWNKQRLVEKFGTEVAEFVDWVTEQDKSDSWAKRKAEYLARLKEAPAEALAIACADKISNIRDSIKWIKLGHPVESFLSNDWETNQQHYLELQQVFQGAVPLALFTEFVTILDEAQELHRKK